MLHGSSSARFSMLYFLAGWKSECCQGKVRKTAKFALCSTCDHLRCAVGECDRAQLDTALTKRRRQLQIDFDVRQRRAYHCGSEKAMLNSSRTCSIIGNGADQVCICVFSLYNRSKRRLRPCFESLPHKHV